MPGLPVILGGVGIGRADLTMLQAAPADEGRVLPLRVHDGALDARDPGRGPAARSLVVRDETGASAQSRIRVVTPAE